MTEVNDIGDQVASILQYDLEYENILMCAMRGRAGQVVGQDFRQEVSTWCQDDTAAVKKLDVPI